MAHGTTSLRSTAGEHSVVDIDTHPHTRMSVALPRTLGSLVDSYSNCKRVVHIGGGGVSKIFTSFCE